MVKNANRRTFLRAGGLTVGALASGGRAQAAPANDARRDAIERAWRAPVLRRDLLPDPVLIESVELLRGPGEFAVRVRSKSGAEGLAIGHADVLETTWPILVERVAPFFAGKDARDLEALLDGVYLANSNYKWQGLAFWVPVASVELAILDLLGKAAAKPIGALFSPDLRRQVAVYRASGNRGNAPDEEIAYLQRLVQETGAQAIKFRLGARMRVDEASTRRDLALIPLTRKSFGDALTIYADANGSYDVAMSLRIGAIMRDHGLSFLEEPVPFDFYEETKAVADALTLPIAGGEQESSIRRFRWMIEHRCVDVVQPDLLYFGGFVRSVKVARMAEAGGLPCTPHMSGGGLGFLYVAHFASCVPNAGPFQEYKGTDEALPVSSPSSSLRSEKGLLTVPSGPGLGVTIDPAFLRAATRLA